MKMTAISFVRIELNRTDLKIQKQKLSFRSSVFKNRLRQFADGSFMCLIHNSSSNTTESTVKVFFLFVVSLHW